MHRILFDVTEKGRKVIAKCYDIPSVNLPEAWNRGSKEDSHVGSIMLSHESLIPVAVFALLENGCKEVYLMGQAVVGIELAGPPDTAETMRLVYELDYTRRLSYGGPSGDRNLHVMSGRVE